MLRRGHYISLNVVYQYYVTPYDFQGQRFRWYNMRVQPVAGVAQQIEVDSPTFSFN